jgi:type I restriction enzyme S subunit
MEYTTYKLGDVLVNFDYLRKPLSSLERKDFQGEFPYYGAQGIIDYVREFRCDGEYMLIAEDGENLSSRKEPIAQIARGKFWVNNHAHIVRTNEKADLYYILYLLNNSDISGYITGAAQPKLSQGSLNKIKISLPSLPLQRRIASILSSYDNLIELNTRRIKLLEQMAENLYKEWFVRFRFPNYQNTPIENGIPKGWRKGQLGEIVNFLNGFAFKSETFVDCAPYKVVTIKNVQDGKFDGINVDYIEEVPKRMPQYCNLLQGDILLSLTGNVGRVCIVLGSNYLLNQRVAKLTSDHPHFTYCLFRTDTIFNTLNSIAYGTAQLNLSPIKAARLKMLIPPVELRNLFDKQVASLFTEIATLQTQSANLTRQRDLLLPRLMSGQLPTQ